MSNLSTDFANALCDPIAYHQESEKRQEQLKSLQLDDEDAEEVGFSSCAKTFEGKLTKMFIVEGLCVIELAFHLNKGTFLLVASCQENWSCCMCCCGKASGLVDMFKLCDYYNDYAVIFRTQPDLKLCKRMVQNQQTQQNKRLH